MFGPYAVEAVLGRGRRATVYRVGHQTGGTLHALKVFDGPPAYHFSCAEKLIRHVHWSIPRVTDVVRVHGRAGLVMDLVEAPSLDRWLRTSRTLEERIDLFRAIALAMAHAHAAGLGYLDPSNILVEDDSVPRVLGLRSDIDPSDDLFVLGRILHRLADEHGQGPTYARHLARDLLNPTTRPRDVEEVLNRLDGQLLESPPRVDGRLPVLTPIF